VADRLGARPARVLGLFLLAYLGGAWSARGQAHYQYVVMIDENLHASILTSTGGNNANIGAALRVDPTKDQSGNLVDPNLLVPTFFYKTPIQALGAGDVMLTDSAGKVSDVIRFPFIDPTKPALGANTLLFYSDKDSDKDEPSPDTDASDVGLPKTQIGTPKVFQEKQLTNADLAPLPIDPAKLPNVTGETGFVYTAVAAKDRTKGDPGSLSGVPDNLIGYVIISGVPEPSPVTLAALMAGVVAFAQGCRAVRRRLGRGSHDTSRDSYG
jgi:hypothetical protein